MIPGSWLNCHLAVAERILWMAVGAIGWTLICIVLDAVGLLN